MIDSEQLSLWIENEDMAAVRFIVGPSFIVFFSRHGMTIFTDPVCDLACQRMSIHWELRDYGHE